MSFAAMETSIDDSRPVELFLITYSGASVGGMHIGSTGNHA